jgi:hypothetical protein
MYEIANREVVESLNQVANEVEADGLWDPSMPGIVSPIVPFGVERLCEVCPVREQAGRGHLVLGRDALRELAAQRRATALEERRTTEEGA